MRILYEDKDIIVAYKEAGVDSQASSGFAQDMLSLLQNTRRKKGEDSYIGVVHRLDKPVSGVMVFAKNKEAAKSLSAQFAAREIVKKYHAVVCGKLVDKCGQMEDYLGKDTGAQRAYLSEPQDESAKRALLSYRVLKEVCLSEQEEVSLLEVEPKTGRFHQIRVQLSGRGHSIVGDRKYGDAAGKNAVCAGLLGAGYPMLHAAYLEFSHPRTKKRISFAEKAEGLAWHKIETIKNAGGT